MAAHAGKNPSSQTPAAINNPTATGEPLKSRLTAIRLELAVGEYTKAQQRLAALVSHYDKLTQEERREVKDDLCLTEYLIGQASYPWSEQQKSCSEALAEPGSVSGAILARIHDAMKQSASEEVRRALEAQDLAGAEATALAYRASPGADSQLLAGWSKDFWQVVHRQERPDEQQQRLAPLIEQLTKEYPEAKTLSEPVFVRWVIATAAFPEKSIIASLTIKGDTLDVLVRESDLPAVATNLYSFVRINDVFAARCGCNARTNLGIADLGFPAYLFRLDSEERTSKILIAMGKPAIGLTLPVSTALGEAIELPIEAKPSTATKARPSTESNQEAQTASKPSPTLLLEGVSGAGASGIVEGSSFAGSASSPEQSPLEQQPKLNSTRPEAGSSSRPSSIQRAPGPTSNAEPRLLDSLALPSYSGLHIFPADIVTKISTVRRSNRWPIASGMDIHSITIAQRVESDLDPAQ